MAGVDADTAPEVFSDAYALAEESVYVGQYVWAAFEHGYRLASVVATGEDGDQVIVRDPEGNACVAVYEVGPGMQPVGEHSFCYLSAVVPFDPINSPLDTEARIQAFDTGADARVAAEDARRAMLELAEEQAGGAEDAKAQRKAEKRAAKEAARAERQARKDARRRVDDGDDDDEVAENSDDDVYARAPVPPAANLRKDRVTRSGAAAGTGDVRQQRALIDDAADRLLGDLLHVTQSVRDEVEGRWRDGADLDKGFIVPEARVIDRFTRVAARRRTLIERLKEVADNGTVTEEERARIRDVILPKLSAFASTDAAFAPVFQIAKSAVGRVPTAPRSSAASAIPPREREQHNGIDALTRAFAFGRARGTRLSIDELHESPAVGEADVSSATISGGATVVPKPHGRAALVMANWKELKQRARGDDLRRDDENLLRAPFVAALTGPTTQDAKQLTQNATRLSLADFRRTQRGSTESLLELDEAGPTAGGHRAFQPSAIPDIGTLRSAGHPASGRASVGMAASAQRSAVPVSVLPLQSDPFAANSPAMAGSNHEDRATSQPSVSARVSRASSQTSAATSGGSAADASLVAWRKAAKHYVIEAMTPYAGGAAIRNQNDFNNMGRKLLDRIFAAYLDRHGVTGFARVTVPAFDTNDARGIRRAVQDYLDIVLQRHKEREAAALRRGNTIAETYAAHAAASAGGGMTISQAISSSAAPYEHSTARRSQDTRDSPAIRRRSESPSGAKGQRKRRQPSSRSGRSSSYSSASSSGSRSSSAASSASSAGSSASSGSSSSASSSSGSSSGSASSSRSSSAASTASSRSR